MTTLSSHASHAHGGAADRHQSAHLLDHEYDGIREYDNPTPGWWHLIFVGTFLFSIFYVAFWHFSPVAWSNEEDWQVAQNAEVKKLFAGREIKADEAGILSVSEDPMLMQYAEGTFRTNCAACHAKDGGGINGVNLCDDYYKNVKKLPDIFAVITNGANNGAMPSWRGNFSEKERVLLAAYVMSLRGTKPASPKNPEGEIIPPFPKAGKSPG